MGLKRSHIPDFQCSISHDLNLTVYLALSCCAMIDIKASNVLLDGELNGRLGDFGLARLYEHGSNPSTTRVVGTLGYLAPELPRTGKATTSSDVYAFGALLLEVVCGRRPIEPKAGPEELVLVDWVGEKWREKRFLDVVDIKLKGEFEEKEVVMVLELGLMCSSNAPLTRPSMRQVVRYLEGEAVVPEVLRPASAYDGGIGDGGDQEGHNDFLHSSSSLEKTTRPYSFMANGDVDASFGSVSTSLRPLLITKGMPDSKGSLLKAIFLTFPGKYFLIQRK
ncbi:unnamed protein product [Ilex paraguariensis]|uniref:non-specific serine/threonine protein kinase n=1 Tax=Ilex paraguariensis TaxID=185542 RepID=A0ABC8UWF9_9AQUA